MCTKLDENALRDAVNEFKGKARNFHIIASSDVELPFEELFFVETAAAEYEVLLSDKKVDGYRVIHLAVKRIMAENPMYSRVKVYMKCRDIYTGNKSGMFFSWKHYAEQYFKRVFPNVAQELISKMRKYVWKYDKQLYTNDGDDFAHVVFACIV